MKTANEKLLKKVSRAGIRKSIKAGHVLSREELLALKVQVLPFYVRVLFFLGAVLAAYLSWLNYGVESFGYAFVEGLCSVLLFLFSLFGVRRTLHKITENLEPGSVVDLLGNALDVISSAVGWLGD